MLKRSIMILLGFLPLALGGLIELLFRTIWNYQFPVLVTTLIAIVLLVVWFFAGLFSARHFKQAAEALLLLNAAGFLAVLLAITIAEPPVGFISRLFFEPILPMAVPFQVLLGIPAYMVFPIGMLLLALLSFIGSKMGRRPTPGPDFIDDGGES